MKSVRQPWDDVSLTALGWRQSVSPGMMSVWQPWDDVSPSALGWCQSSLQPRLYAGPNYCQSHVLVDTWMLTVKPVYKLKMCLLTWNRLQTHTWHHLHLLLRNFGRPFFVFALSVCLPVQAVHPYFYPSTVVITHPPLDGSLHKAMVLSVSGRGKGKDNRGAAVHWWNGEGDRIDYSLPACVLLLATQRTHRWYFQTYYTDTQFRP